MGIWVSVTKLESSCLSLPTKVDSTLEVPWLIVEKVGFRSREAAPALPLQNINLSGVSLPCSHSSVLSVVVASCDFTTAHPESLSCLQLDSASAEPPVGQEVDLEVTCLSVFRLLFGVRLYGEESCGRAVGRTVKNKSQ